MVAALVTTLGGVTYGIVASIALSLVLIASNASRPSTAVLGRLPGTNFFVSCKRYPDARELSGIKILRFDGALTFSNRDHFEARVRKMEVQDTSLAPIHTVIIDCSSVTTIDTSAIRVIQRVAKELSKRGREMIFANWRGIDEVGKRVLEAFDFGKTISQQKFFLSIADAVDYANEKQMQKHTTEINVQVVPSTSECSHSTDLS